MASCAGLEPDDVVFQTAAAVWDVNTPDHVYEDVNVDGNRSVLDVCRERGIRRLVYTSTIDVVVDGRRPVVDGDESLPYPERLPRDAYSRTKIEAEQLMLAADSPELATCALRPVGMYGPRDRYHLGNMVAMARKGNKLRLGSGSARFSHAYSENVAHAHVLAAYHLFPGSNAAGNAYFIGDHYPAENFFDFMQPFLEALDLPDAAPQHSLSGSLRTGLRGRARRPALELQPLRRHPNLRRPHLPPRSRRAGIRLSPGGVSGGGLPALGGRPESGAGLLVFRRDSSRRRRSQNRPLW